ncbi:hypothetical protein E2C01_081454 [Portunus trituberculatus]|uniref:Uncharacterized protein n=1 Tax=Portunus trituberculatus TaxID=210409 RepID=A0A5B7IWQ3_PORTR|nr:hypothetical protein [Portunus trituberculatus]
MEQDPGGTPFSTTSSSRPITHCCHTIEDRNKKPSLQNKASRSGCVGETVQIVASVCDHDGSSSLVLVMIYQKRLPVK